MLDDACVVEMEKLAGMHKLSGVGYEWTGREDEYYAGGWFVIDGIKYTAIVDPGDGYRSCMDKLIKSEAEKKDVLFEPVDVMCRIRGGDDDIIDVIDGENGEIILSVGTENVKDYYPCFIFEYTPERMERNRDVGK